MTDDSNIDLSAPMRKPKKSIYNMKLHETMNIVHGKKVYFHETGADECDAFIKIMRVESGWIYGVDTQTPAFVPETKIPRPDRNVKVPDPVWNDESYSPLTEGKTRNVPKPPPSRILPEGKSASLLKFWKWFK